ncbi:type 1 fimbrial protein [Serratia sp. S1B]|nr:type 1 fimbrial protein [Serratia sp. S1B]
MLQQLISRYLRKSKLVLPIWLLISPLALAQPCRNASDNCKIDVQFVGNFLENTCDLVINGAGNNEIVILPTISVTALGYSGAEGGSQPFDITLSNCPTNKAISLYFASTATGSNISTGNLLNTVDSGYSKNVEVRLRRSDQQQMVVNDASSAQEYIVQNGDDVTHQFIASYYATNTDINAGAIKTSAAIVVDYK